MRISRILTAAALIGGIGVGGPAATQPYDPYDNNSGYGYNPGNQILQGVIDGLLGNRYDVSDRRAVHRCANAAVNEAWNQFRPYGGGYGFGPGYGYDSNYPQMRVTAITDVDRRSSGLRIRGMIDSGLLYAQPYQDRRYAGGDLIFRCNVDYRGRVWDVRVNRNPDFRPPY
ncbi:MAG TPA: hypothetical protein VFU80_07250 [Sphingomicrobium sp.]|nr:hypothetical protein [Sphingomicrobium sp.]